MKKLPTLFGLFFLFTLPTDFLWAGDTINLAVTNLPPFQIVNGDKVEDCINIRVLKEILDPMDIKINYQVMPFQRCLVNLKNGKSDIFMGILRRPEREVYLHYVQPAYKQHSTKAFFLPKGKSQMLQKYEDLYKLTVGVRLGFKYFPQFDNDRKIRKEVTSTNKQNLKMLLKGRIDALAITEITGEYLIALYGYDFEKAPFKYAKINPAYLTISKKSRFMDRLGEFEKYSRKVVDEQIYKKVEDEFLSHIKTNTITQ